MDIKNSGIVRRMSKGEDALITITYITTIVVVFIFCILLAHGPVSLFEKEPFKTIGEFQRNPTFWYFSIITILIWVGFMVRLEGKPFGGG